MDITNFMTWFLGQIGTFFTWIYTTLDSFTFAGTSLLKVIITINIIIPLVSVVLTISKNTSSIAERSIQVKEKYSHKEEGKK